MARTIFLKVRVTKEERETAHEVAERQGLDISQIVRRAFGLDTARKDQAD
jgi:antitoxin component of RelBE/YafQ-DinJ toxin-antitoxin module